MRIYTLNRLRYLALNGTPYGLKPALREEWKWLKSWRGKRGRRAILQAYGMAARRWFGWRRERSSRPHVGKI